MTRIATSVAVLGSFIVVSAFALQDDTADATSLKAAVEDFNQKTRTHSIGKTQLPLTEDEVVAAIGGWIPDHTPGVTDDVYDQFQGIAESRKLPEGAELSFCPGWTGYRGYRFKVWWIDLSIKTGENAGYTFRIRDQKISSRKMTPGELDRIEGRESKPPKPSDGRPDRGEQSDEHERETSALSVLNLSSFPRSSLSRPSSHSAL